MPQPNNLPRLRDSNIVDLGEVARKSRDVDTTEKAEARTQRGQDMTREQALNMFAGAFQQLTPLSPMEVQLVEERTGFGFAWSFVPRNPLKLFRPEDRNVILVALSSLAMPSEFVTRPEGYQADHGPRECHWCGSQYSARQVAKALEAERGGWGTDALPHNSHCFVTECAELFRKFQQLMAADSAPQNGASA